MLIHNNAVEDLTTSEEIGRQRYQSKRSAGISKFRSDGSQTSVDTDIQSTAAEKFACDFFDAPFNNEVYARRGDDGYDFLLLNKQVEVIWLGYERGTKIPRKNKGNLIVNPHEQHRWADIYIVVQGDTHSEFSFTGWTTHKRLIEQPKKDFGYGERYAMSVIDLAPIEWLVKIIKEVD